MRRICAIAWLCAVPLVAIATPPIDEIVITPRNEGQSDFSILLVGKGESRELIVYAPPHTHGDCLPARSGTELLGENGKLIYSQWMYLGLVKGRPELRGQMTQSIQVLKLWIDYFCPQGHMQDGARYVFLSSDWEKSGKMR